MAFGKQARTAVLAALIGAATAFAALAASPFEGTWSVKDTDGKAFEITLGADGKATSTHPKEMTGTWAEEGSAAVVKWNTGWTTKIVKDGDTYKKEAFKADGSPAGTSEAAKK
jgi:hypothetical protein